MRPESRWRIALTIIGVLIGMVGIFILTYFLTGWLFQVTGWHFSAFFTFLANVVLGIFFIMCSISLVSFIMRAQQLEAQMGWYRPFSEAMQRIARGDFSVRLDNAHRDNPVMVNLTESINNMALELDQMETMRQEFISNVSHELQSPLTSIRGFAQALQSEDLSVADRSHYLSIIETESLRLSKIADNLLKLASLEADQVKFEPTPYRLDSQIRHLILACEPQWMGKAIDMNVSLTDVSVVADADLLSQVWLNLLHNSIKFTPEGGKISVSLHQGVDGVICTVEDSGIGIAPEDQPHIFERFYMADKSRTHAQNGGSGLGLAITKKIVEMHQGAINVCSQIGSGATFTVSLPAGD